MRELNEILPYISDKKCILFIGAGLSKIAGCYDWDSVVKKLTEHEVIKKKIKLGDIEKSRLSNEEWIDFCQQELSSNGKENDFWGIVRRAVMREPTKFQNIYLPLIKKNREIKPFPNIITTNIDSCLEDAEIVKLNKIFYEANDFNISNLI